MSASQYPTAYNPLRTSEPNGPGPLGNYPCGLKMHWLTDEYPGVIENVMVDGGATHGADSTNAVKRIELNYTGLTSTAAAILDAHYATAQGTYLDFSFRDWRTDTLYTGVHYQDFQKDHVKTENQSRVVTLVIRPV